MEQENLINPTTVPTVNQPDVSSSIGFVDKPKSQFPFIMIILMVIISLALLIIFMVYTFTKTTVTMVKTPPIATSAATPTPTRRFSAIASQSAFIALDEHVASLSASINHFILDDPTLTPPVIELPLGY